MLCYVSGITTSIRSKARNSQSHCHDPTVWSEHEISNRSLLNFDELSLPKTSIHRETVTYKHEHNYKTKKNQNQTNPYIPLSLEYQFDVTVSNNTISVPRAGTRSQHVCVLIATH